MGSHGFEAKPATRALELVGLALALVAAGPSAARAGDPPRELEQARLSLVRGEGADVCFVAGDLEARVRARLGRDPFSPTATKSIEAFVARGEKGFVAKLFVRSGRATAGARELASDAEDCSALESAVILAVALTIDPDAALRPPPAPTAAPLAPAPPPIEPPRHDPPVVITSTPVSSSSVIEPSFPVRSSPASAPSPWHVTTSASFVGEAGVLPGVAPGVALGAEVRRGFGLVRALAVFFPETKTRDAGYAFGLTMGSLAGCVEPARAARLAFALCGGVVVGAVHAVPFVNTPTRPGDRGLFAFDGGARVELVVAAPLVASLSLDALAPPVRYKFLVQGLPDPVYEQAPVAGLGAISLGASFP